MKQREIAALICKALGLYFSVSALVQLPSVFVLLRTAAATPTPGFGDSQSMFRLQELLTGLPGMALLIAGICLWVGSESLAAKMVANPEFSLEPVMLGREAKSLVFSAIGLWTLVQAAPRVATIFVRLFLFSRQDALMRVDSRGMEAPDIVGLLIQIGLGLWLLFGASGLAGIARGVGKDAVEVDSQ